MQTRLHTVMGSIGRMLNSNKDAYTPSGSMQYLNISLCVECLLRMNRAIAVSLLFIASLPLFSTSIISWNIRDFGKTKSALEVHEIAQILRNYDIIAIQEVVAKDPGGAKAVGRLAAELNRMGYKWDYAISDPTKSPSAYRSERYAYLWKTSRVERISKPRLIHELSNNVDREPFYIRFRGKKNKRVYDILNFHSRKHSENPEEEVYAISQLILANSEEYNWILAGDFNLTEEHEVWRMLYSKGYGSALKNQKTTLKMKCIQGLYLNHAIDNIYYNKLTNKMTSSAAIDYFKKCDLVEKARMLSDHLPVFAELN